VDANAKTGTLGIRIGLGWAKSHGFTTGQCPVMRYHRGLMQAILHDKIQIAKAVNATVISLDQGPGLQGFRQWARPKKYVIDPHKMVAGRRDKVELVARPARRVIAAGFVPG